MYSAAQQEIRQQLCRYLAGDIGLGEFQRWFVPSTWNVEKLADPDAETLVNEIHLRLAEFSNGHLVEAELREKLSPLVVQYTIRFGTSARVALVSAVTAPQVVYSWSYAGR